MNIIRIASGLFLILYTGLCPAATWTQANSGLTGSVAGISHLAIDGSGSTLYAAGNGLFRSTDGGAHWKLLSVLGVQAVALDPTSGSTVYAGTAQGVVKSTDGGETWSAAGLAGKRVSILVVDPRTPSTLYAAAGDGNVYKSTDGGQRWTAWAVGLPSGSLGPPPAPTASVSALLLDPATPSTLYLIPASPIGGPLYKSTDGAQSWSVVNPGPVVRLLGIDPTTTPSTVYGIVGGRGPGFSKSTDGGASFTALGLHQDVWALSIDPHNSNTLYAATTAPVGSPPVIYKSIDGGQNWNASNSNLPLAQALVVSPTDSSTIYAPTNPFFAPNTGGIFKSTDAGMTWSQSNTGLRVFGVQVLEADPLDSAIIYAGGDEGLFKSTDRGGSWNPQGAFQITCCDVPPGPGGLPPPISAIPPFPAVAPASVHSLLIDFTNPNILYAGTARNGGCFFQDVLLFKTTDDGTTWSNNINPSQSGCSDDSLLAMDPVNPNTIYLRAGDDFDGFGMRKTTDGGATWGFTHLGANELNALVIDPTRPATLYAATDDGVVGSPDGGDTWNPVGLAKTNVSLLTIDPLQPNVLYAATSSTYPDTPGFHSLLRSVDNGATWSPINSGLEDLINAHAQVTALRVNPLNTNLLYLAAMGYGVFRSSDSGAHWAPDNEGLTFLDVRALEVSRSDPSVVLAATSGGVFRIIEGAASASGPMFLKKNGAVNSIAPRAARIAWNGRSALQLPLTPR
jgi:photosystem II stability/assembly factor-like uncharacterized protein